MGAFTVVTAERTTAGAGDGLEQFYVEATGPASYDSGGSIVDLSSYCKNKVYNVDVTVHGTALYHGTFVPGASNGAALGKIKLFVAAGTSEPSGNLSGVTYGLTVTGDDA